MNVYYWIIFTQCFFPFFLLFSFSLWIRCVCLCARAVKIIFYLLGVALSVIVIRPFSCRCVWSDGDSFFSLVVFLSISSFYQANWEYYFAFIEFQAFLFCLHFSFLFPVISTSFFFSLFIQSTSFVFDLCFFVVVVCQRWTVLVCASHYVFIHTNLFFCHFVALI